MRLSCFGHAGRLNSRLGIYRVIHFRDGLADFTISFGAFSILMYLIKFGSLPDRHPFFLVPPVSAVMAGLFVAKI